MTPPRKKLRLSVDGVATVASSEPEDAPVKGAPEKEATAKVAGEKDTTQQNRSLFVRSLPASATTESLTELFSQSFPIKHATAVIDRETKLCKGYGFVTFADAEDCQLAKDQFNGFTVDGRKIRCEVAESRQRQKEPGAAPHLTAGQKVKEQRDKERSEQQPPKLIVRNLPWSIKNEEQLTKLFMSYGKVKHVNIPKKKAGLMSGFALVVMRGRKNAEKAMAGINGKEIDGRTLAVDWAVEKEVWQNMNGGDEEKVDGEKQDGDAEGESPAVDENIVDGVFDDDGEADEDDEDDEDDMSGLDEMDEDDMDGEEDEKPRRDDNSSTLFIRNLPFTCSDEDLEDHFSQFGSVRYARIVLDHATERPRGTGFVCFYSTDDAEAVLKTAPRHQAPRPMDSKSRDTQVNKSILQNEDNDPSGKYTMDGRVLQVSPAVNKSEANRLTEEGAANRFKRDTDRRRLYLLSEGTIASNSPLYQELPPSEQTMREASMKQRKTLIESNPSLHLSLTRLSIRNIPRSITSKDLKQLAREAVVGFAKDVKESKRGRLSKEELHRGGEEMVKAEKDRKARAKGVVKQAKIVFEGREGSKVQEKSGAGRSRGYGFIEYYTHRSALMGLRWLNGHAIDYQTQEKEGKGKKASREVVAERKKRLIVEFAIENAQVVVRRKEAEEKMRERPADYKKPDKNADRTSSRDDKSGRKRKRDAKEEAKKPKEEEVAAKAPADEKTAKRERIIQRKRMIRRARSKGAKA